MIRLNRLLLVALSASLPGCNPPAPPVSASIAPSADNIQGGSRQAVYQGFMRGCTSSFRASLPATTVSTSAELKIDRTCKCSADTFLSSLNNDDYLRYASLVLNDRSIESEPKLAAQLRQIALDCAKTNL